MSRCLFFGEIYHYHSTKRPSMFPVREEKAKLTLPATTQHTGKEASDAKPVVLLKGYQNTKWTITTYTAALGNGHTNLDLLDSSKINIRRQLSLLRLVHKAKRSDERIEHDKPVPIVNFGPSASASPPHCEKTLQPRLTS